MQRAHLQNENGPRIAPVAKNRAPLLAGRRAVEVLLRAHEPRDVTLGICPQMIALPLRPVASTRGREIGAASAAETPRLTIS